AHASGVPRGCCPSGCGGGQQKALIPTSVLASWSRPCVLASGGQDRPTRCRVVAAGRPRPAASRLAQQDPRDGPVVVDSSDTGRECAAAIPRPKTSTPASPCP